ncbi:hypothetical protein ACFX13_007372 [Malus domestica]
MDRNEELLQIFAFGCWRLWKCRNAATFQGELCPPEEAISLMKKPRKEWTDANQRGCCAELLCRPPSGTQHNLQRRKPEIGRLKVNSVEHGKRIQYQEELGGS